MLDYLTFLDKGVPSVSRSKRGRGPIAPFFPECFFFISTYSFTVSGSGTSPFDLVNNRKNVLLEASEEMSSSLLLLVWEGDRAHALRVGLELPPITVPEEADMTDNLNYCPYHRRLGHILEICYTLKSWIQNQIHQGNIVLAPNFYKDLLRAEPSTCNMVGFGSDSDEELNFPEEEEEPKMVDQMQLIKRKTLPERQPPVAKDKRKEKQIEIEEDAIPQQRKNPPMPDSNIFSNFKKLPALLSIFDVLCM